MAVPKKKRIGYRILNRGAQARAWHLRMINLTASSVASAPLMGLLNFQRGTAAPNPLLPHPKRRPLGGVNPTKRRLFGEEGSPFALRALITNFGYRPSWGPDRLSGALPPALGLFLIRHPLTRMLRPPHTSCSPLPLYPLTTSPQMARLALKRLGVALQLPHKWGGQGNYLLRRWELSPAHLSLGTFGPGGSKASWGYLKLNRPVNLSEPTGPSLRDLWLYIKTNPNEGYWMYCMWLQIKKKWRRWVRFPLQFFMRRNIWQRTLLWPLFYRTLDQHRLKFPSVKRVTVLSWLRAAITQKQKFKRSNPSLLTRLALRVNIFMPLSLPRPPGRRSLTVMPSERAPLRRMGRRAASWGAWLYSCWRRWTQPPL